jgi:hypothetical protein
LLNLGKVTRKTNIFGDKISFFKVSKPNAHTVTPTGLSLAGLALHGRTILAKLRAYYDNSHG